MNAGDEGGPVIMDSTDSINDGMARPWYTRWSVPLTLGVLLLVAMLVPSPDLSGAESGLTALVGPDKVLHVVGMGMFAASLTLTLAASARSTHPYTTAFIVAALYGVVLESLHYVIPYRLFLLGDIAANVGGAALGVGCVVLYVHFIDED